MPELRGDLAFVGLTALLRFIAELGVTGRLHVAAGRGEGDLWLQGGRVVGASFGAQRGPRALDALARVAADGHFRLSEQPLPATRDVDAPIEDILSRMEEMNAAVRELRPLLAARWVVTPPQAVGEAIASDASIVLDRHSLDVLLAVNRGRHTVDEIAAEGDVIEVARALSRLREQGLVQVQAQGQAETSRAGTRAAQGASTAGEPFVPSGEWQEVPAGTAVPPGGEYRLELGGKVYARWPAPIPPLTRRPAPEAPSV